MPTSCLWRRLAILLDRTRSAGFFAQWTAARIGRRYFTKTKTLVGLISPLIPTMRMCFLLPCGRCAAAHGISPVAGRGAALIGAMTPARPGSASRREGCPRGRMGALASQYPLIPVAYPHLSKGVAVV